CACARKQEDQQDERLHGMSLQLRTGGSPPAQVFPTRPDSSTQGRGMLSSAWRCSSSDGRGYLIVTSPPSIEWPRSHRRHGYEATGAASVAKVVRSAWKSTEPSRSIPARLRAVRKGFLIDRPARPKTKGVSPEAWR